MTRWRPGEADIEQLLANRDLQLVTGTVADGHPALERAGRTLVSAQTLLDTDPINAFVLAYDAVRQACAHRRRVVARVMSERRGSSPGRERSGPSGTGTSPAERR